MVFSSIFSIQEQQQNPIFANLDEGLYCEEQDLGEGYGSEDGEKGFKCEGNKTSTFLENDVFWEDDELFRLLCKEKESYLGSNNNNNNKTNLDPDGSLMVEARKEAVEWMLKVVAHFGFTALTGVLAVKYYDRFTSDVCFQEDKPWMNQLVAVACLSVAAKMEEIQVPLLVDLQVESSKYVFEAKTIMRMELLVLSALKWRTSPVTPISFFDHIARRFKLMINLHQEFLKRCESILLSIIADPRLVHYLPSVIATAAMLFVVNGIDPYDVMDYQNQLIDVLKINKEKVEECYQLIIELRGSRCLEQYETRKRKNQSVPASPSGVIDAYFSSDSSNDSWSVASSVSSSPKPMFKRSRAQDQPMKLAPLRNVSVGFAAKFR